jgi:SAM-dependent methyltransferase
MTLRFCTKAEIWSLESAEARDRLAQTADWRLKTIQDAVAMDRLIGLKGLDIGEIGGGASRVLPLLGVDNRCFNIDPFDGSGFGLNKVVTTENVTTIVGAVGGPLAWPANAFDLLFSISVVEHVPTEALPAFFDDCRRLLRPNGLMLHLIDIYIDDAGARRANTKARMQAYHAPFETWLEPTGKVMAVAEARFSCAFATNPDPVMAQWNKLSPGLRSVREQSQSCVLLLEGSKRR